MLHTHTPGTFQNRLLAALVSSDLDFLEKDFERVALERRQPLEHPNKKIEHAYFMEDGVASVVAEGHSGRQIEVGLIGYEGVSGLAIILGNDRSPQSTFMQIAGRGLKIPAPVFRAAIDRVPELRTVLLHYAQTFLVQTAQTAAANARGSVEERLSRWVLMAHDRVQGDDIALTHEFMAVMLGVRRPGVTEAVQTLSRKGLIRAERGVVTVIDREGLLRRAGKLYGIAEAEYARLIGPLRKL